MNSLADWTSCLLFMLLLLGVLSRNVIDLPLGKWLVLAVPSILESAAALEMNNAEKKWDVLLIGGQQQPQQHSPKILHSAVSCAFSTISID